jgi:hypothetical protein
VCEDVEVEVEEEDCRTEERTVCNEVTELVKDTECGKVVDDVCQNVTDQVSRSFNRRFESRQVKEQKQVLFNVRAKKCVIS